LGRANLVNGPAATAADAATIQRDRHAAVFNRDFPGFRPAPDLAIGDGVNQRITVRTQILDQIGEPAEVKRYRAEILPPHRGAHHVAAGRSVEGRPTTGHVLRHRGGSVRHRPRRRCRVRQVREVWHIDTTAPQLLPHRRACRIIPGLCKAVQAVSRHAGQVWLGQGSRDGSTDGDGRGRDALPCPAVNLARTRSHQLASAIREAGGRCLDLLQKTRTGAEFLSAVQADHYATFARPQHLSHGTVIRATRIDKANAITGREIAHRSRRTGRRAGGSITHPRRDLPVSGRRSRAGGGCLGSPRRAQRSHRLKEPLRSSPEPQSFNGVLEPPFRLTVGWIRSQVCRHRVRQLRMTFDQIRQAVFVRIEHRGIRDRTGCRGSTERPRLCRGTADAHGLRRRNEAGDELRNTANQASGCRLRVAHLRQRPLIRARKTGQGTHASLIARPGGQGFERFRRLLPCVTDAAENLFRRL